MQTRDTVILKKWRVDVGTTVSGEHNENTCLVEKFREGMPRVDVGTTVCHTTINLILICE